MSGWLRRVAGRFATSGLPPAFAGRLVAEERVLASAELAEGGHLVATSLGLWVPDGEGSRRIGWHLISKATWDTGSLGLTEAEETGTVEGVVLLADRPVRRFRLAEPGPLPAAVHARVTGSIRSSHRRELPGGGAWLVQRSVAGRDGIVLQVRADPGTAPQAVRELAAQVGTRVREVKRPD